MISALLEHITVNEQNSIRVETDGTVLRVDPFHLSAETHDADVILLTHSHYDHFSPEDIARCASDQTVFVYPASMEKEFAALGIPSERCRPMRAGESAVVCSVTVEAVPAYNRFKPFHPKAKGWLGYVLTAQGVRIYAAGDTDRTREAQAVECDIALLPIGGTYTMDAEDAALLADALSPQAVIPTHYGTVVGSPEAFRRFAEAVHSVPVVEKLSL